MDYFNTFECHICGETKNSNHSLKKHYILSHYSINLKNLKGETKFPSECQFGIELGCLGQFQNYEDYLVHIGTDHDKLFDVMIESEKNLDLSDHTSLFTNSVCNIYPDKVLSILSTVGPCTIGANLKTIFKDHPDFKGCSSKKIFLNDLTNESAYHKGQMESDVYKQRCGNFLSQASVTSCERHVTSFLKDFKRTFTDRKRNCLCRFVQKGIEFEYQGLKLDKHCASIPFEKCQKLHLHFDRFILCDLKVCKNCRGKIKKDVEKHEEMLNKPIASPLSEMDTDDPAPSISGLDLADLGLNLDSDIENSGN